MDKPRDLDELKSLARALAGCRLEQLALVQSVAVPQDLRRTKGWVGSLVERALGVQDTTFAGPDFPELGVEIKTLPVDSRGRPRESTWVCSAPLDGSLAADWRASSVWAKLARVLWVPVEAAAEIPVGQRRIGTPLLWSPSAREEATLREDWEELSELIRLGCVEDVDARIGTWLQVRPKAAHGRSTTWTLGQDATWVLANPRGFYLRASFTAALLERHWVLPGES